MRVRNRIRSHERYKARKEALATTRSNLERLKSFNADNHRAIFNVAMYLLLLDQDLADFTDDIINATGERKRVFIAKYEAILIYEASEDIKQLLGKEFRQALIGLQISEVQSQKFKEASSKLNEFWHTNREYLKSTRNMLAAHRHHNTLEYIETLDQLKPIAIMKLAADLSECINQFSSVLTDITLYVSTPKSILRDWLDSSKKKRDS